MTHVFVAPHPDDVALSCGGLIAGLRELGQNVSILTVFSGTGDPNLLTAYQREALGFGSKAIWPATEAFNRANLANDYPIDETQAPWAASPDRLDETQREADASARRFWQRSSWYRRADIHNRATEGQPLVDDVPQQGAVLTAELIEAEEAGAIAAARRLEDERYALFAEASVVFLDLADAVYRGYEGDAELLGVPRPDDAAPVDLLRREIARLEPQRVYLPLGVGNHVDHQLMREVGLALLEETPAWIMPGPDWVGRVVFYEDFPYALWRDFNHLADLPAGTLDALPDGVSLYPEYAEISDQVERKVSGVTLYASQIDRLFGGRRQMADAVRAHARKVAAIGATGSMAERYWVSTRI
ncbi:MAG: PIG-L family deacetylase [Chloroflexi bacterium]|nr:PIG-L family deacetylase [Chloroflexota bacterium]